MYCRVRLSALCLFMCYKHIIGDTKIEKVTRFTIEKLSFQALLITSFPCLTPFNAISLSARFVSSLA